MLSWKEFLLRQARLNSMCLDNMDALRACQTKAEAVNLYKKTIDKLNKKHIEEIGTERTQGRPLNIICDKLENIEKEEQKYEGDAELKKEIEEKKERIKNKIEDVPKDTSSICFYTLPSCSLEHITFRNWDQATRHHQVVPIKIRTDLGTCIIRSCSQ